MDKLLCLLSGSNIPFKSSESRHIIREQGRPQFHTHRLFAWEIDPSESTLLQLHLHLSDPHWRVVWHLTWRRTWQCTGRTTRTSCWSRAPRWCPPGRSLQSSSPGNEGVTRCIRTAFQTQMIFMLSFFLKGVTVVMLAFFCWSTQTTWENNIDWI